jgi:cell division protein FtsQ
MSVGKSIRKLLLLSLVIVAGGGVVALLVAAISKKSRTTCTGVDITINGIKDNCFLDKGEVMDMIAQEKGRGPKGRRINSVNLQALEAAVRHNVWVKDAELFFDNNGVLKITIDEREPVARLFTASGSSFYIDSSGRQLPLSDKMVVRLPVFTNFPTDRQVLNGTDSILMQQVKQISGYIREHPVWQEQVAQVAVMPDGSFEMVPVIGNHRVVFGNGDDCEKKFHRLMLFYRQVASKAGFDKYSVINVQYDRQVIATRKEPAGRIDSLQALKNVQRLIEASHHLAFDSLSTPVDNNITVSEKADTSLSVTTTRPESTGQPPSLPKTSARPQPAQQAKTPATYEKRKPKAVMKSNH